MAGKVIVISAGESPVPIIFLRFRRDRSDAEMDPGPPLELRGPAGFGGRIIGRGGNTIKRIQQESGATIKVVEEFNHTLVLVSGKDEQRLAAERLIRPLFKNSGPPARNESATRHDPSKHTNYDKNSKREISAPLPFGFRQLEEMLTKEPYDILSVFTSQSKKFQVTLESSLKPDIIVLFVKCLAKICNVSFEESKLNILMKVCMSPFIKQLETYFMELPFVKIVEKKDNWLYWNNMEEFWIDVLQLFNTIIEITPSVAYKCIKKTINITKFTFELLQENQKERFPESIITDFNNIQFKIAIISENESIKMRAEINDRKSNETESDVPDDYKTIAVLPSSHELNSYTDTFLRPIIVDGAYSSVGHYLDVQFRLMREDYVSPMRKSIRSFIKDPNLKKYEGGRFYKNIRFSHLVVSANCIGLAVKFSTRKNVPKSFYRRFLYGALLCFTSDNFETIIFGTIIERSMESLQQGLIIVELVDMELNDDIFEKTFTMYESDVFFLQYGPVLKILKNFKESVPMQEYVVYMRESKYIPEYISMDKLLPIWKSESENLDEYQSTAFEGALTKEFVTIQGPPGTGKTYLGLKLATTILCGTSNENFPILVLCYTNHALDQFLEGLVTTTKKIVRIGGQSKNEEFSSTYNLQNLRKKIKNHNPYRNDLFKQVSVIKNLQKIIENVENPENITDVKLFENFIPSFCKFKRQIQSYSKHNPKRSYLVNWLLMSDDVALLFQYNKLQEAHNDFPETINDEIYDDFTGDSNNKFIETFETDENKAEYCWEETLRFDINQLIQQLKNIQQTLIKGKNDRLQSELQLLLVEIQYLRAMFSDTDMIEIELDIAKVNFSNLTSEQRWGMYRYWNSQLKDIIVTLMNKYHVQYKTFFKLYEESNLMRDTLILNEADVIGVTTTAAARLSSLLTSVGAKIVIVEEAAEVLESHIIVNITEKCQHLILIGDHQQLRPSTASYMLGQKYNLEISLFERMFKNKKNCFKLAVQHRMRPEISKLITPSIYDILIDHDSVKHYPNVKGVTKNLYFINHSHLEEKDEIINSYMNRYEAKFVLSLAKYLIQQGYKQEEITILMPYSGQMFCIRELKKTENMLQNVKVSILDNFQGEENKIILLSLVRSNDANTIGFLSTPNRICVALSRAREGFFLVGNMNNLIVKCELWKTINNTLVNQDSIGLSLPLKCEIHGTVSQVSSHADFSLKVPEGGCNLLCNKLLSCAHTCGSLCHIDLDNHANYRCMKKCEKFCELKHRCQLNCCEACKCFIVVEKNLKCGHSINIPCYMDPLLVNCKIMIEITLTRCSHKVTVTCYDFHHKKNDDILCQEPCINRLPCGHKCRIKCHVNDDPEHIKYNCMEKCTENYRSCTQDHKCQKLCHETCDICTFKVTKKRILCAHSEQIECHKDVNSVPCQKKCAKMLPCHHFCKKKCGEPCGNCKTIVKKVRSCGHSLSVECDGNVEDIKCRNKCLLKLACGHPCQDRCSDKCGLKSCEELIKNPFISICGHAFKIPCYYKKQEGDMKLILSKYCDMPCNQILKDCEHACVGRCGDCRGRLHVPCGQPCENLLICGHSCNDPCRAGCSSCQKLCEMRCVHSKCPGKCGTPCRPCKEKCIRRCKHGECKHSCGVKCSIPPCSEPCPKKLKCGHSCISLCGELCPEICRICNPDDLPVDLFGTDYNENTKFVQLVDCKHLVEVNDLDTWIDKSLDGNKIAYAQCPYCKTNIINTQRYLDKARQTFIDIQKTKLKTYGNEQQNKEEIKLLIKDIQKLLSEEILQVFKTVPLWKIILNKWKNEPDIKFHWEKKSSENPKKKILQLNKIDIQNFKSKVMILEKLSSIIIKGRLQIDREITNNQINFILKAINRCGRKLSQQEADDFSNELKRTEYLVAYDKLMASFKFGDGNKPSDIVNLENMVYSVKPLTESDCEKARVIIKRFDQYVSDEERLMIVRAINLRQGHWYKCKNGHPYCIGECGGAMEISNCPECGCEIGGKNHALVTGNALAPEMDGAKFSAYSEAATDEYLIRNGLI